MNPALAYEAMARNSCFCVAMRIVAPTMIMTGTKAKMSSVSAQLRMKPMMRPMTKAALARGVDPRVRRRSCRADYAPSRGRAGLTHEVLHGEADALVDAPLDGRSVLLHPRRDLAGLVHVEPADVLAEHGLEVRDADAIGLALR